MAPASKKAAGGVCHALLARAKGDRRNDRYFRARRLGVKDTAFVYYW
ncbi:MAG: hypothetical protein WCK76_00805 [Elusimicrobiota bacterium]